MGSLNTYEIQRRQELTEKLKNNQLERVEAQELKQILEKEKNTAITLGDFLALVGIGFLLALVIDSLTRDSN